MSNNLGLDQVAENQAAKEVTINTATGQLDAALTEGLAVSVTSGNVVLTNTQYRRALMFTVSGATVAGRTVTVPAVKKLSVFSAAAANTQSVNLVRGTTTITLSPGSIVTVYSDGTANGLVLTASPPDIQAMLNGISSVRGSILYRGNTSWAALAAGTAGFVLQTNGVGADPNWVAQSGGGGGGGTGLPASGAMMYRAATGTGQALTGSASTVIQYDTTDYADSGYICTPGSGTIQVPSAGYYMITAHTRFDTAPASGYYVSSVRVNSLTVGRGTQMNAQPQELTTSVVVKLAANDVISQELFCSSAANTTGSADKRFTRLSVARLGDTSPAFRHAWACTATTLTPSASAFATKGVLLDLAETTIVKSARFVVPSPTNGDQYVVRIYSVNTAGLISGIPGVANTVTWNTGNSTSMEATFPTPLTLAPGLYIVSVSWANAPSGTSTLGIQAQGTNPQLPFWPAMPTSGLNNGFGTIANVAPAIGDTFTLTNPSSSGAYMIALKYTTLT